jgi:hypothetical protein
MKPLGACLGLVLVLAATADRVAASDSRQSSPTEVQKACGLERVRVRSDNRTRCVSVWRYLGGRSIRIPALTPGAPCPTTPPSGDLSALTGYVGTAFGRGPVYPGFPGDTQRAEIFFHYPPRRGSRFYGSLWSGQKVMWILARGFAGPALVRGRQLDGRAEVRFDFGLMPSPTRRLRGHSSNPSFTRLHAPGCYAYQIDGLRFSYRVVFEAKLFAS